MRKVDDTSFFFPPRRSLLHFGMVNGRFGLCVPTLPDPSGPLPVTSKCNRPHASGSRPGKMLLSSIPIKHPDSILSVSSASGLALEQCICLRTSCKSTLETISPHFGVYLTSCSSPGHSVCLSYALAWRRIIRHICTNERGQIQRV